MNRRQFARSLAGASVAPLAFAGRAKAGGDDLGGRADRALEAGLRALVAAQSPDGAWRSSTYGAFKDGLALTAPVLKALAIAPDVAGIADARARGAAFLARQVRDDGTIDVGAFPIVYPVYAASAAVIALTLLPTTDSHRVRNAWLRDLRKRQVVESLGWTPDDPAFGGWGYSIELPRKDDLRGRNTVDADLSSTLFAVGAIRIAGAGVDDPAILKALAFIRTCQNFPEDGRDADPRFDDGGFFLSPVDPARNKAGEAGTDRRGRARHRSYGSASADGLRALLRCGLPPGHPRVEAARLWLERHFSATANPGAFEPIRAIERESTFFYYAWSVAHAFRSLGLGTIATDAGPIAWADALAAEMIRLQRPDGTWANRFTASKEDDPLVATSFAVGALGNCRPKVGHPEN